MNGETQDHNSHEVKTVEDSGSWLGRARQQISQTDIGSLPVVLALILIAIIFQIANPNLLTPLNLTNLLSQTTAIGTISVGIVAGVVIGPFQGWWIAWFKVPSFVITPAGFLGWQGALLAVLGSTGAINLNDPLLIGLVNSRLPVVVGWALGVVFLAVFGLNMFRRRQRRAAAGLTTQSMDWMLGSFVVIGVLALVSIRMRNVNRNPRANIPIQGVPTGVIIFIGFIILFDFVVRRTKFGRYVFAVGGNAEDACRADINVERIRITVFVLGSTLAACGGILAASRLYAVNQSSGGGNVLLNSIAAAVIGGTSLFGGRGSTWSALLGVLVIGAIANGMDLLAFASSIRLMVTGAVLLISVTLDAYTRSRRERRGR